MRWYELLGGIVAAGTIAGAISGFAVWFVRQSIAHSLAQFELRLRAWLAKDFVSRPELDALSERENERFQLVTYQLMELRAQWKKG